MQKKTEEKKTVPMKGTGGLSSCPKCNNGNDITVGERNYQDAGKMTQELTCDDCGAKFSETWRAVEWKEEA